MSHAESDIDDFTNFARRERADGGATLTLRQPLVRWEEARETDKVVDCLRRREAEAKAGGGRPADEVIAEVREKLTGR